jgi:quercetin dioxygenase-like cupin family protein/SAM-dependent methyltransferase
MCNSENLYKFLDLGFAPPSDAILTKEELSEPELQFPLTVFQCRDCGLTQLGYAVNPVLMYGEKYRYESSITETGRNHFYAMADSICDKFNLSPDSFVIDLGSNVGVLLEGFKRRNMRILGIDPAPKIAKIANERGIETLQEFVNPEVALKIVSERGKAKIIAATNVFAHIDDKEGLMQSVKIMLDGDGVFIIEAPYFVDLVENMEYDTIYLDHLEYLSVRPLVNFFKRHDMEVFDVERYGIHGKSIRVFVSRIGQRKISSSVQELLDLEQNKKIYEKETLDEFAKKVEQHKKDFVNLLRELKKQGKKIVGISSPAKGNTLLNYCKINTDLVDYMTEKSMIKRGLYTPGMHIPILWEEKLLEESPDYGIIFAWNFAEEIIKNNQEFARRGGKFINPIPHPRIMEYIEKIPGIEVEKINPAFSDDRGKITDLLNRSINHVGLITTRAGSVRGEHYHKLSTQYSYILSGKFEVLVASVYNPKNVKKIILEEGELITIEPKTMHRFKAIEDAIMIDMISESRAGSKYEEDVVRVKMEEDQEK